MGKTRSPLRYPGGKSKIYNNIRNLIMANGFTNKTYVEPFVGGFGVGIALLEDRIIEQAIINDLDIHLYHFWNAVLHQTEALIDLVRETPVTIDERMRQKQIYSNEESPPPARWFLYTLFKSSKLFRGFICRATWRKEAGQRVPDRMPIQQK